MPKIAFIAPRFARGRTVGGAETLLKNQAAYLHSQGWDVTFLSTCAVNHFTWKNELEPGFREIDGMSVGLFPVDDRDLPLFHSLQSRICSANNLSKQEEFEWIKNSVNSAPLCDYLSANSSRFDRIVVGPYLFGLPFFASKVSPEKTILVPCLHDEPFARLSIFKDMFRDVASGMFNTTAEKNLAVSLISNCVRDWPCVGAGIEPFDASSDSFLRKYEITKPYILYSGRKEMLKGTPLLIDYFKTFHERSATDIQLVLTGSGEIDIPSGLTGHIHDLGFVSEEDKRAAMAAAVAFCHPSVNESLGIVLLEAWMVRTPALVHASSPVLVDQCRSSGAGLWFSFYPEFEEELKLLVENREFNRKLGELGRKYVLDEYSWKKVGDRLKSALRF